MFRVCLFFTVGLFDEIADTGYIEAMSARHTSGKNAYAVTDFSENLITVYSLLYVFEHLTLINSFCLKRVTVIRN